MNKELLSAIEYLSKEKGVTADVICDSLEAVLITAYKKEYDGNQRYGSLRPVDRRLQHRVSQDGCG